MVCNFTSWIDSFFLDTRYLFLFENQETNISSASYNLMAFKPKLLQVLLYVVPYYFFVEINETCLQRTCTVLSSYDVIVHYGKGLERSKPHGAGATVYL